jgi:uncharacterized membrane protein (UPF0127 family)
MGSNERKREHRRKEYLILTVFFVLVGALAFFLQAQVLANQTLKAHFVAPSQQVSETLSLRIASTPAQRAKGLMFEKSLEPNEGMLFIFPAAAPRTFWMKNTPLSLDMIFIGSDRKVIGVVDRTEPFSEQQYSVSGSSQYVVELNAGQAAALGIVSGSQILFDGPIPKAVVGSAAGTNN